MSRATALRSRLFCLLMAICLLLATFSFFVPVHAWETPQTLEIYAQYWADPDSAQLLGEYTRDELTALSYSDEMGYEGNYCNVTRVNTVMRIHARGVKLAEFLEKKVGVDLNSVRQLDFHTADVGEGERFVSKGRQELLDDVRWYYPNLYNNFHEDVENDTIVIDDEEKVLEGAVQVPTIIAVEQYSTKNPIDDLSDPMSTEDTFRLCAGQLDMTTKSSFESARWVDAIYVVLAGSPPEEPTDTDEDPTDPTQPDEQPTGSDITPTQEDPTDPTEPEKPTGSNITPTQPSGTIPNTTRRTTRRYTTLTYGTTRPSGVTNRTVTMTKTSPYIAQGTTAVSAEKMGQLVVNGYDVQWRKESEEEVTPLQKRTVTTSGARNAALMFLVSFAAGGIAMFQWYKEEK